MAVAQMMVGFMMMLVFGGMMLFWLLWVSFIVLAMIFWVMMLIDATKREYSKPDDKIIWILVVALTGVIGGLIYYFTIKRPADRALTT